MKLLNLKKMKKVIAILGAQKPKGVCDTLDCTSGIENVAIPECGDVDYGQKIVKVFLALPDAPDFSSSSDLATQATWQTKLGYDPTGANGGDRIVAIGPLHNGLKPEAEDETEEGPYGGDELVSRKHTINFEIKRWNQALFTAINKLRCRDSYKMWYLTNTGYLFGGITGFEDVSARFGSLEHGGLGNGKSKSSNTITWLQTDDSLPVAASFLKELTN